MAAKQDFTLEEWTKILESTMLAGVAVSAADPSGLWGTLKEFLANVSALGDSALNPGSDELIKAVVSESETGKGMSDIQKALHRRFAGAKEPADYVQHSLAGLRDVCVIIDRKAPGDAAAFKGWLYGIGEKVAEASMEGGFLGFGGVKVSDAEKATLGDIARTLGTTV